MPYAQFREEKSGKEGQGAAKGRQKNNNNN